MVRKSVNLLPAYYRTDKNNKFLSATMDPFIDVPVLDRLDSFIGSKLSRNYKPSTDNYVSQTTELRDKYQLEPGLVIKTLAGDIKKAFGLDDLINQLAYHNLPTENLNNIFSPDFYSYDPHIDWDKLINFREYYWLPTGPSSIQVTGTQRELISTFSITDASEGPFFVFSPDGITPSPTLTLYRGVTYVFDVNTQNNFYFKKTFDSGIDNLYNDDIIGNGTKNGQIIFYVSYTAPSILYYGSDVENAVGGQVLVKTIEENSFINVEREILGKESYTSGNGVEFVNGLKVYFGGDVNPPQYRNKDFIVEGVGQQIQLIDFSLLETPESIAARYDVDFDMENFDNFPFDNFKNVPLDPSYITINRSSKDLNPWTRYNRWFHSSVLAAVAKYNNQSLELPLDKQARRPIIEFKPNLQLYNFGNVAFGNVDLIDNLTTDVFSNVENSIGYWVDNIRLEEGFRVIFNADPDPFVRGKIFTVQILTINGQTRVNLIETDTPSIGSCVTVTRGEQNKGTIWWYNSVDGEEQWIKGQQKTSINQAPLFDIFDEDGNSYSGSPYTSNFRGNKIFGYAESDAGVIDPVLGIPLKYQTNGLESSYLFENYFNTQSIIRVFPDTSVTMPTNIGFLKNNDSLTEPRYLDVWSNTIRYQIPVYQFQETFNEFDQVELIVYDNPAYIQDLKIEVFIDNQKTTDWTLISDVNRLFVNFNNLIPAAQTGTTVRIDCYSNTAPNSLGVYYAPINLTNNPLNGPCAEFTLTELYDHVNTMVLRHPSFQGTFPGQGNLNSLNDAAQYGTRIVANKNPLIMSHFFITNKENNIIQAIKNISDDYDQFKLSFLKILSEQDDLGTASQNVDAVMNTLNQNKNVTFPYFATGMVPCGTNKKIRTYNVTDFRNTDYSISFNYNPKQVNAQAILVYLNDVQLLFGKDYTFDPVDTTVVISTPLTKGDKLVIVEYNNTDGCYVPPTPTKLGLYAKFEPAKYLDDSFVGQAEYVIQGHDGSLMVAFNDYRDDAILELEKRIFNNIKVEYDPALLDMNTVLPSVYRSQYFTYKQIYELVSDMFIKWAGFNGFNFEQNTTYDVDDHKTYNYKSAIDYVFDDSRKLPGSWRAIYKTYFDTDRPHTHPWEMLGFSIKPDWWDTRYGVAPYTSGNEILWKDLEEGRIAEGPTAGITPNYARPGLTAIIPVDESGNLVDLRSWGSIGLNDSLPDTDQPWSFGDWGPVENGWRRSSIWPFAVQIIAALCKPADYCAKLFDTSRMKRSVAGQYLYTSTIIDQTLYSFISPSRLSLYSDVENGQVVRGTGYSVFVIEYGKKSNKLYVENLKNDLRLATVNLVSKLGGFVSKDKLSFIVDSMSLSSKNPSPYLPNENFQIYFNTSNPIKTVSISGLIIIKDQGKFTIRGYDRQNLYFKIYKPIHQNLDSVLIVGGKSADALTWTANQFYNRGQIVLYNNAYYTVISDHNSLTSFNKNYYQAIPELPFVGGVRVSNASVYETTETIVPYGTSYTTLQEVYDFILGYNQWLTRTGFEFDEYSQDFSQVINWTFSAKEFLYWTTQNWAAGSVITLSPFANQLKFKFDRGIVDNVLDSFYGYSLLRNDGLQFPVDQFSVVREGDTFVIKTRNTNDGIFFAKLNIVQKEHMVIFDNKTIFNDVLYDDESGYRQTRVKVRGFKTAEWNGTFFTPGFLFDAAQIQTWSPFRLYIAGEVVEYVGKYYSAINKVQPSQTFQFDQWVALTQKPQQQLLPNYEYKITQFEDFYSLDVDNFDNAQQQMSQHLVGFSPRPYLENIFSNLISQYKFYQGYIKDKGTQNALAKLEKASVQNLQGKLEFSEEWAFRLGNYGGYSTYNEIELPLRERDFIENSQAITFVDVLPEAKNVLISYITPEDLTIKPDNYLPSSVFKTYTGQGNNFVLPYAGYVRLDDVQYTFKQSSNITEIEDISTIKEGQVAWVGFEPTGGWNVYRFTRHPQYVISASIGEVGTETIIRTNAPHGLQKGDIIALTRMDTAVNGVYEIQRIQSSYEFVVNASLTISIANAASGVIFKFSRVRFNDIDSLADYSNLADIRENELVWVDNNGQGKWTVYKKIDNYSRTEYPAPRVKAGQRFGYKIAKQENTATIVVAADKFQDITGGSGRIYVYEFVDNNLKPITNYALNSSINEFRPSSDTAGFGDALFFDETDGIIFVSASNASNVKVDLSGDVKQARSTNAESIKTNIGLVKLSGVYNGNKTFTQEEPYCVLVSPDQLDNERFGSGLFVQRKQGSKRILIGAPGYYGNSVNTGSVYLFNLSINNPSYTKNDTSSGGDTSTFVVSRLDKQYAVTFTQTGTLYTTSSVIIVNGADLGGKTPENNLRIFVLGVNEFGSISNYRTSGTSVLNNVDVTVFAHQKKIPTTNSSGANPFQSPPTLGSEFGFKVVGNADTDIIAISAPNYDKARGAVYLYKWNETSPAQYEWFQTIAGTQTSFASVLDIGCRFGTELEMSENGQYLFIGSTIANAAGNHPGIVAVYTYLNGRYEFIQLLKNPSSQGYQTFGHSVSVNSSGTILSIASQGVTYYQNVSFDNNRTTFDGGSCLFVEKTPNSGSAFVYNRFDDKFILSQQLFDNTIDRGSFYGEDIHVDDHTIFVGSPGSLAGTTPNGSIYIWNEIEKDKESWDVYRVQEPLVDTRLLKSAKTIDSFKENIIDYFDVIDPLKGNIPGIADQEIRYKTAFDPAIYSFGEQNSRDGVVNLDNYWTKGQLGQLWWDLSTVKYIWYEQGDLQYRKNTWGQLFPGSSIDVYEWVESEYKPSQYAVLADTDAGITLGISGQPKFIDDTYYSSTEYYDKNRNEFKTLYYFWVRNKSIVPNKGERRLAAFEVASLLSNPKEYGLRYLGVISPNALSLVNFRSKLISDRIYLNLAFDSLLQSNNRHTEWILVQENNENGRIPEYLETKLLDSLLGKDKLGNLVPDSNLPSRTRYGIEIRPRQTMFVDRVAALKNLIEYTNNVLSGMIIRGYVDFDTLNSKDEIPDVLLGEYDQLVENIEGRDVIITKNFVQANLTCEVNNGKITNVNILNPGKGYLHPPTIKILDNNGAELQTVIDQSGSIVAVNIKNPGQKFLSAPVLLVRAYTVIVETDINYNNKWVKYEWSGRVWEKVQTQKFDTTKYWEYIDWKASKFNPEKLLVATIDELYQLVELELFEGDYVKVNNPGDGKYVILEKTKSEVQGSFNNDFDIIYSEQGTIRIKDSVWNLSDSQLGFDDIATFDQLLFDESADVELEKILQAIKQDIFSGPRRIYWNKFFFKAIKYALTEQKLLDWAFKTSFINVRNISGVLDQRSTYRFQDPTWYEDYLKEIKPYHTQIRNYQVNYQVGNSQDTPYEASNTFNTDFDLPSYYDQSLQAFNTVTEQNILIDTYPWKSWKDNKGFQIETIKLVSGGSGYRTVPKIEIIPAHGDTITNTATAVAYIAFGKITEIEIVNNGDGYTKTPTVLISGGGDTELTKAVAYPILTNKKVRSSYIGIKFDRITTNREIGSTSTTFTTATNGTVFSWQLPWQSSTSKDDIEVYLDGILMLDTDYNIINYSEDFTPLLASQSYKKKFSKIEFETIPSKGKTLTVIFKKNINLYSAAERIQDYYKPGVGMPGNQLAQLMQGAEYPGVSLTGMEFKDTAGYDTAEFDSNYWDTNPAINQVFTTVTNVVTAGTSTIRVMFNDGISPGQTITIGDKLPLSTIVTSIDNSVGTYTNVSAVSTASYLITVTGAVKYFNVESTSTNGSGARFNVIRSANNYTDVQLVNTGTNYQESNTVTIRGNLLGGITPDNDITLYIITTASTGFGMGAFAVVGGAAVNTPTTATFFINRLENNYNITVINSGTNLNTSTSFFIDQSQLGGYFPSSALTINVTATNVTGSIGAISFIGTPTIGTGATFNVVTNGGKYTVSLANSGTNYLTQSPSSSVLTIYGHQLGGVTPTNNLVITVTSTSTYSGNITGITYSGIAVGPVLSINRPALNTVSIGTQATLYNLLINDPNLDTFLSGGSLTTNTNGFSTARGIAANDIIIDGDRLVTPYTSYAPEEMVPGQVQESLSISVFTRIDEGSPIIKYQTQYIAASNTSTSILLSTLPSSSAAVLVSYNNKALVNNIDYQLDFNQNTLSLYPRNTSGIVSISTIKVGGKQILLSDVFTTNNTSFTKNLNANYDTVKSSYVTVNGQPFPATTGTTFGYTLAPISRTKRSAKISLYGMNTGANVIQVWLFESAFKGFTEVREETFNVTTTGTTFTLANVPGQLGPYHGQVIVNKNGNLLLPPDTTYYTVENNQTSFVIRPDDLGPPGLFDLSVIEVFRNGVKLNGGVDFILVSIQNRIQFNPGFLVNGDILAIAILVDNEFEVSSNQLILRSPAVPGDVINVTTFNNSDYAQIRTEVFRYTGSRMFTMSRSILDDSYVWVSIQDKPLTSRVDYRIANDYKTIIIDPSYPMTINDRVVIMSLTDKNVQESVGYRIFHNLHNNIQFTRISEQNTTYLAEDLAITATSITVVNGNVLTIPQPELNRPGVIFVAGERIEYFEKSGNTLSRLRRATHGTGANDLYTAGTTVVDQSRNQTIPYSETRTVEHFTVTSTTTYQFAAISFDTNLSLHDQIEVYYQGKLLQKPTTSTVVRYRHNKDIAFDSGERDSDEVLSAEFTVIDSAQPKLQLNFVPELGKKLFAVHKTGKIWYANDGRTILATDSIQSKFLLEKQAGLPDKYQYGKF